MHISTQMHRDQKGRNIQMKLHKSFFAPAVLLAILSTASVAVAQEALPTASRTLQLSAFGAVGGDFTGLSGGKNFLVLAGADLGLPNWRAIRPTIEVRGTYPADHGLVDSQKSILAGLKTDFLPNHRLRPYADFLVGRGEMNYRLGYLYNNLVYTLTTTNVYSFGGGLDYDLNEHLVVRVDGQVQRWGYAPTPSGDVYAKVGIAGIAYRFNFDHHPKP